jgi:hypothetical protein
MSAQPAGEWQPGGIAPTTQMGSPWHYARPRRHPEVVMVDLGDLQEAHERMHPDGTHYIEYCPELTCRHLLGAA